MRPRCCARRAMRPIPGSKRQHGRSAPDRDHARLFVSPRLPTADETIRRRYADLFIWTAGMLRCEASDEMVRQCARFGTAAEPRRAHWASVRSEARRRPVGSLPTVKAAAATVVVRRCVPSRAPRGVCATVESANGADAVARCSVLPRTTRLPSWGHGPCVSWNSSSAGHASVLASPHTVRCHISTVTDQRARPAQPLALAMLDIALLGPGMSGKS